VVRHNSSEKIAERTAEADTDSAAETAAIVADKADMREAQVSDLLSAL
jgi:hypothetical protein